LAWQSVGTCVERRPPFPRRLEQCLRGSPGGTRGAAARRLRRVVEDPRAEDHACLRGAAAWHAHVNAKIHLILADDWELLGTGSAYENGSWKLRGAWSILEYEAERARRMLEEAKDYLEGLLRPLDPDYRCVSFRSGSWCIAPGKHVLRALAELGIVFDMSIV